jgi:hypothetical protein
MYEVSVSKIQSKASLKSHLLDSTTTWNETVKSKSTFSKEHFCNECVIRDLIALDKYTLKVGKWNLKLNTENCKIVLGKG